MSDENRGALVRRLVSKPVVAVLVSAWVFLLAVGSADAQRDAGRLQGLDGGTLTEDQLASGDSVVIFWASWSPRCRDIVEQINPIHKAWSGKARVVSVNWQEEPEAIRGFLSGKALAAPVYMDRSGAFSKKLEVVDLPGLVIYKNGAVAYQGKLPRDAGALLTRVLG